MESSLIDDSNQFIWESMLINERRAQASQQGKRISDWEEEHSLLSAIQESLENKDNSTQSASISDTKGDHFLPKLENDFSEKQIDANSFTLEEEPVDLYIDSSRYISIDTISDSNVLSFGREQRGKDEDEEVSIWYQLPTELAQRILIILGDIDMCGYLCMVAKENPFKPSEVVYRSICETIFPKQTLKKTLKVDNWRLWKNMAIYRPRLRTNGFYCLRTSYTRAPCNDNFWEDRRSEFIEVKYYRYMRFFDDGYMLYSMDIIDPWDMPKYLEPGLPVYKKIYEGRYSFKGNDLIVEVLLHYCVVKFVLKVLDGDDGYNGKHNMLTILEHSSVPLSSHQKKHQQALDHQHNNPYHQTINKRPLYDSITTMYKNNLELSLSQVSDAHKVTYPLNSSSNLRFYRHWNWQSKIFS